MRARGSKKNVTKCEEYACSSERNPYPGLTSEQKKSILLPAYKNLKKEVNGAVKKLRKQINRELARDQDEIYIGDALNILRTLENKNMQYYKNKFKTDVQQKLDNTVLPKITKKFQDVLSLIGQVSEHSRTLKHFEFVKPMEEEINNLLKDFKSKGLKSTGSKLDEILLSGSKSNYLKKESPLLFNRMYSTYNGLKTLNQLLLSYSKWDGKMDEYELAKRQHYPVSFF